MLPTRVTTVFWYILLKLKSENIYLHDEMSQEVLERKTNIGETQPHPNYKLLLLRQTQKDIDFIEARLKRHIPGMSSDKAHQISVAANREGVALVWTGPKEIAELYYELLKSEGLSMALEPDA